MTSRKRSKNGGDGGTGVYMLEGTNWMVIEGDRLYGEFYNIYKVSPEYFGYTFVHDWEFLFHFLSVPSFLKTRGKNRTIL
jgi:hypothetical protein